MSLEAQELDIEAAYHAVSDTYLGSDVDIHALCRDKRNNEPVMRGDLISHPLPERIPPLIGTDRHDRGVDVEHVLTGGSLGRIHRTGSRHGDVRQFWHLAPGTGREILQYSLFGTDQQAGLAQIDAIPPGCFKAWYGNLSTQRQIHLERAGTLGIGRGHGNTSQQI